MKIARIFGLILGLQLVFAFSGTAHASPQTITLTPTAPGAQAHDVVIPQGATAVYDAKNGPLTINGKLVNHGTLQVISSKKSVQDATIQATEIINDGAITSALDKLTLKGGNAVRFVVDGANGSIAVTKQLEIVSQSDLSVAGGSLKATDLSFTAKADATIDTATIDGAVSVSAKTGSIHVARGRLNLAKYDIAGDPIFYSYDNDAPAFSGNVPVVAVAFKNVTGTTVNTPFAPIKLAAGVRFAFTNPNLPQSGTGTIQDQQCLPQACIDVVTILGPSSDGGSIIAGGANLSGTSIQIEAHAGSGSDGNIEIGQVTNTQRLVAKADGKITVNGNITTAAQSPGAVQLEAGFGDLAINSQADIKVNGNITVKKGAVFIRAGGNVGTGNIDTSDPSIATVIDIYANLGKPGSLTMPFSLGGGGDNGTGTLNISTNTGNGNNQFISAGGLHIKARGTGGMVIDGNAVNASATNSRGGLILLESPDGTLQVTNTLTTNSPRGGYIVLLGKEFSAVNAVLDASSAAGSSNTQFVWIAAEKVTGDSLTVRCNGNGRNATDRSVVALMPKGSAEITDSMDPLHPTFGASLLGDGLNGVAAPLDINVSGQLILSANGVFNTTQVSGTPLTFAGGPVNASADGDSSSMLTVFSGPTNATGLAFGGSSKITLSSNGSVFAGGGGTVTIQADRAVTPVSQIVASANGTTNGGTILATFTNTDMTGPASSGGFAFSATGSSANGGNIAVNSPDGRLVLSNQGDTNFPTADVSALGSSGDAGAINITVKGIRMPGNMNMIFANALGSGRGNFINITDTSALSNALNLNDADTSASSLQSGGAGTIQVTANSRAVTINGGKLAANGGPQGDNSGGTIKVTAKGLSVVGGQKISTQASGLGQGGTIDLEDVSTADSTPIVIGNQAGQIKLAANGGSLGSGGTVSVKANSRPITANGANIDVLAGNSGNGNGGRIVLRSNAAVTLTGTLKADARGTGIQGEIDIQATSLDATGTQLSADGNFPAGKVIPSIKVTATQGAKLGTLSAKGVSANTNGGLVQITAGDDISFGETFIQSSPNGNATGGTLNVTGQKKITSGIVHAAGRGNMKGGNVSLTGDTLALSGAIDTDGGASGDGGHVTLKQTASLLALTLGAEVDARGGTSGGAGGELAITSGDRIDVQAKLLANARFSGAQGGKIKLNTGPNFTAAPNVNIGARIDADGAQAEISMNLGTASSGVQLNGDVSADAPSGAQPGRITVSNLGGPLPITGPASLSAASGELIFTAGGPDISVKSLTGDITATGGVVTISVTGNAANELRLKSIQADSGNVTITGKSSTVTVLNSGQNTPAVSAKGTVDIQVDKVDVALGAGSGQDFISADGSGVAINIHTDNNASGDITIGSELRAPNGDVKLTTHTTGSISTNGSGRVQANRLDVKTDAGSVLGQNGSFESAVLKLQANTARPGAGQIFVHNSNQGANDLDIQNGSGSGGSFAISADGGINVGSLTNDQGDITLLTDGGKLNVRFNSTITASSGQLVLTVNQGSGRIELNNGAQLVSNGQNARVAISVGGSPLQTCPASQPGCTPTGLQVSPPNSPNVFFGAPMGIKIGLGDSVTSVNGGVIAFDTNGAPFSRITLDDGCQVSANR